MTFLANGVEVETIGAQSIGNLVGAIDSNHGLIDGFMRIETGLPNNGGVFASVPVTEAQFNTLLNYSISLAEGGAQYNYHLFTASCATVAQHIFELSNHPGHFGDLFAPSNTGGGPVWNIIPRNYANGPFQPAYDPVAPIPWDSPPAIEDFANVVGPENWFEFVFDSPNHTVTYENIESDGSHVVLEHIASPEIFENPIGELVYTVTTYRYLLDPQDPNLVLSTQVTVVDLPLANRNCFPAGTPITLIDGTTKPIEAITQSDVVLSHDADGNPVAGVVDKLFTNTTSDFIRLSFADGRDDLVATPGHRFLTETGDYMEIGQMLRLGGGVVRVVDLDGSIVEAAGEVIAYSAETAHMFAQSATKTIAF